MKTHASIPALLVAATFVALATGASAAPAVPASTHTVAISASNWSFATTEVTVRVNQVATLAVTSGAGVHGLASSELGIPQTTIVPGKTKTITFTPTKVGTYVLHCTIPCGRGHADMALTIRVVA